MHNAQTALSLAKRIDIACDQFELDFKAGHSPQIDDFVARAAESDRDTLRAALEAIEQEFRERSLVDTSVTRNSQVATIDHTSDGTASFPSTTEALPQTISRFEILGILGSGAYGCVYKARDPQIRREVAIKVPLPSTIASMADKNRFLREARTAATINHPNVCQIFEIGEHEGCPYIVMGIVAGSSLAEVLKELKSPLPTAQIAQIAHKIALALTAAHERGIVHRDLKPSNVMFDRERQDIVVMDFGLARGPEFGEARVTQTGVVMGTPAYMSPEQARGDSKEVGPSGDIYALGVLLYELMTGSRPFVGTATEVIGQILHVEPIAPSQRKADVDPALEAICLKAMAKDPAKRFGSMRELAMALGNLPRSPTVLDTPAVDTARAEETIKQAVPSMSDATDPSNVFSASSVDRQVERTANMVKGRVTLGRPNRALRNRTAIVATLLGGMLLIAGVIFVIQSRGVRVMVEVTDIDLSDETLRYLLDNRPITAQELSKKIELTVGEHDLVVKRGNTIVHHKKLTVNRKGNRLKVDHLTLPPSGMTAINTDPDSKAAEWVLALGGKQLTIQAGGPEQHIKNASELPQSGFQVTRIDVSGKAVTDADLKRLEGLSALIDFYAADTPITDAGLVHLSGLQALEDLQLPRSQVVGDGLRYLKDLPKLRVIQLEGTPLTDAGLGHLRGQNLTYVGISYTDVTDAGFAHLSSMTNLDTLWAVRTKITDAGLAHLQGLTNLRHIDLSKTQITDAGLARLKGLNFVEFWISYTQITDAGLEHLSGMTNLKWLSVEGTQVTGAGLIHLKGTNLTILRASNSAMDDRGLEHLRHHTELWELSLSGCSKVTDAGLAHLQGLTKMRFLNLAATSVTDAGLKNLTDMTALELVHLGSTRITDAGVAELKRALPNCQIHR